jgi:hypothetical protein
LNIKLIGLVTISMVWNMLYVATKN